MNVGEHCTLYTLTVIRLKKRLTSPDMHFIDPIKMLEVSAEHEDGKEVDAQFWIVHVSKRKN